MGTDTLSVSLTKTEDPLATPYGVATDNNRSAAVFNGVFQEKWNTLEYLLKRAADLFGTPILISGVSAALDKITTATAHGLSAGTLIRFKALNGGTLPGGLDTAGFSGYLLADTATTFQVSLTSGGAAIDITTAGSGNLYVYAVPDVLAELITSSGSGVLGSLKALFVTLGGAQTITGAKVVDDITASGTTKYKLASRGVTRVQRGPWTDAASPSVIEFHEQGFDVVAGDIWIKALDLPHGCTLTKVSVTVDPGAHASLPANMPKLAIVKHELATNTPSYVVTDNPDGSGSTGVYNTIHAFDSTVVAEVIDNTAYAYFARFTQESGANSATGQLVGLTATYTVTAMDDGAS